MSQQARNRLLVMIESTQRKERAQVFGNRQIKQTIERVNAFLSRNARNTAIDPSLIFRLDGLQDMDQVPVSCKQAPRRHLQFLAQGIAKGRIAHCGHQGLALDTEHWLPGSQWLQWIRRLKCEIEHQWGGSHCALHAVSARIGNTDRLQVVEHTVRREA